MQTNEFKSGEHALYGGQEFRASYDPVDQTVRLITEDAALASQYGLTPWRKEKFTKIVPLNDLDSFYDYITFAVYGGVEVLLANVIEGNAILIYSGMETEVERLGFEQIDRNTYKKSVPVAEIADVKVEKRAKLGFALPKENA